MSDLPNAPPDAAFRPTSDIVEEMLASDPGATTLGALLETFGARSHGLALLILTLPELLPLPVPSLGILVAIPLFIVSGHLVLYGNAAALPRALHRRRLAPAIAVAIRRYALPALRRLESISQRRLVGLADHPRLAGIGCAWLSVLLFLPIPFFNFPLALCLATIALGLIGRDGAFVLAGALMTAAITAALVYAAEGIMEAGRQVLSYLGF